MFQIQEKYGGVAQLFDAMKAPGREGFAVACEAAAIMAEQGELVRRYLGYDAEPITTAEAIQATTAPSEIPELAQAITASISLGFGREIDEEADEVDLGLVELNAQKKTT
jgi:activator of 2-hydroxyglutaryl-CoA dehydratase